MEKKKGWFPAESLGAERGNHKDRKHKAKAILRKFNSIPDVQECDAREDAWRTKIWEQTKSFFSKEQLKKEKAVLPIISFGGDRGN
jgi:hypothetical protein